MRKTLGWLAFLFMTCELSAAPPVRTGLVFPFENQSARSDLAWISESFSEILPSRLASPSLYVLGRDERNAAYARLGIPAGTPLTLASQYKVAETLGVDWAVVGNFAVESERLTARAQLLEVHRLKLSPVLEVTGELSELVDVQTRLAWRLLATHDSDFTVGKEEDFCGRFPDVRLDAFENCIRGLLSPDDEARVRFLVESDRLDTADHRAAFELGRFYFAQKDYANSAKWLRKIRDTDANYLESLFLVAVDQFFLGQLTAAEKAFEALATQIPLNEVLNNLGVMKAHRGRYAEAQVWFERSYQSDPTDADFCFNLGACFWELKKYREAAKCLEEAVRANGEDPEARMLLAAALGKLGDAGGQRRELARLAEHEGDSGTNSNGDFAPQVRLKKNYDGRAFRLLALAVGNALEERLRSEPNARHGDVHLRRGNKFLAENRWSEAERELTEAVSLLPRDSEAHFALARVYEAQGRHREAAAELETSLQLKNSAMAHLWLARVYLSLDQTEAARDHSEAALRLDPRNAEAERLIDQIRMRAARKTP